MAIRRVLDVFREETTRNLVKIILTEGARDPSVARIFEEQLVQSGSPWISGYIETQIKHGTLRPVDSVQYLTLAKKVVIVSLSLGINDARKKQSSFNHPMGVSLMSGCGEEGRMDTLPG